MKKRFCVCGTLDKFERKWDCNLKEMKMKCRDLLLEEYCNKLFSLMDSSWMGISGRCIDIYWLVKVKGHLDKVEKEQ